jgi:hypothetical protein
MAPSLTLSDVAFFTVVLVLFTAIGALWLRILSLDYDPRTDPLAIQRRELMRRPPVWLRVVGALLCLLAVALGLLVLWTARVEHAVGSYRRALSPGHFWMGVAIWIIIPVLSMMLFFRIVRSLFRR